MARGVWAADAETTVTATTETAQPKSPLSLLGYWSVQSGVVSPKDPAYSAESDFTLYSGYKLSDTYKLLADFGFKKELNAQQRLLGTNGSVGLGHAPIALNPYVNLSPSASMTIPISEVSRNQDTLYTSVNASAWFDIDGGVVGAKPLQVTYIGKVSRSFYQYDLSSTGKTNIEYGLKHTLWVTYNFNPKLSYFQTVIATQGWNYVGHETNNYEFDEELDYALNKNFTVGVGLSNSGDVMAANKQDLNVEVYNPYSASVYGQLILRY